MLSLLESETTQTNGEEVEYRVEDPGDPERKVNRDQTKHHVTTRFARNPAANSTATKSQRSKPDRIQWWNTAAVSE